MSETIKRWCVVALLIAAGLALPACADGDESANSTPADTTVSNTATTNTTTTTTNASAPAATNTAATNSSAPTRPVPPNYGGAVDSVDCEHITGWAWNSADDKADISVELYIDNKFVEKVPARAPRPDLQKAGLGTGNYAFGFKIPPAYKDGKQHTLSVKVAGSNYTVPIYEKIKPTFTCPSSQS